jgi:hypothetical protein
MFFLIKIIVSTDVMAHAYSLVDLYQRFGVARYSIIMVEERTPLSWLHKILFKIHFNIHPSTHAYISKSLALVF